jgi:hypothetical protein
MEIIHLVLHHPIDHSSRTLISSNFYHEVRILAGCTQCMGNGKGNGTYGCGTIAHLIEIWVCGVQHIKGSKPRTT